MATLTPQTIVETGLEASYASAGVSGDVFPNDGRTFVEIINASGADITVTPQVQRGSAVLDGFGTVTKTEAGITVTAGERRHIGPFPKAAYDNASGQVELTYSAVTSVTVAALRLPAVR